MELQAQKVKKKSKSAKSSRGNVPSYDVQSTEELLHKLEALPVITDVPDLHIEEEFSPAEPSLSTSTGEAPQAQSDSVADVVSLNAENSSVDPCLPLVDSSGPVAEKSAVVDASVTAVEQQESGSDGVSQMEIDADESQATTDVITSTVECSVELLVSSSISASQQAISETASVRDTLVVLQEQVKATEIYPKLDVASSHKVVHPKIAQSSALERCLARDSLAERTTASLYPPLTEMQLKSFYCNPELDGCAEFVEKFITTELNIRPDKWYKLLSQFVSSSAKYSTTLKEVEDRRSDWSSSRNAVWRIEEVPVRQQGKCAEGKPGRGFAQYQTAIYDNAAAEKLAGLTDNLRDLQCFKRVLHQFQLELSRRRCQAYVDHVISNCVTSSALSAKASGAISIDFSGSALFSALRSTVRNCLSVSFHFLRLPGFSEEILSYMQSWTSTLVGALLRFATPFDHLFVLNHVLRCPSAVVDWAAVFVQPLPVYTPSIDSKKYIDHFIAMLNFIAIPIKAREEFLKKLLIIDDTDRGDSEWTVVDDEGDEDEQASLQRIQEKDLLRLLNQFSFDRVFLLVLQTYCSSFEAASESTVLTIFAFEYTLLGILQTGVRTYEGTHFRAFCRQFCYIIRQSMQYIGEFWGETNQQMIAQRFPAASVTRLQQAFDQLFCRAVHYVVSAQKIGAWQFIVDLPFASVSLPYLWKVVYLLMVGSNNITLNDLLKKELRGANDDSSFTDTKCIEVMLNDMMETDSVYLVNALSNVACNCSDTALAQFVTAAIFHACFIYEETRELMCKSGRSFIGAICQRHPSMMSVLLKRIDQHIAPLKEYALYVLADVPFASWRISNEDLAIVRRFLTSGDVNAVPNYLARKLLSSFHLEEYHFEQVSEMVCEAYGKHVHKQAKPDATFQVYCWDLPASLLNLRPLPRSYNLVTSELMQGECKSENPTSLFILLNTNYAAELPGSFERVNGVFDVLLAGYHYKPAIISLLRVAFCHFRQSELLFNDRFLSFASQLIHADELTYLQYAKSFISSEFPGSYLRLVCGFILEQVWRRQLVQLNEVDHFCSFVCQLLAKCALKKQLWTGDRNILYLMDQCLRLCFLADPSMSMTRSVFAELLKGLSSKTKGGGWFSSGATSNASLVIEALISRSQFATYPFLAYVALLCEEAALEQQVRNLENCCLRNPGLPLDKMLKKSDKHGGTTPDQLPVYSWLCLAVALPDAHPLLPLACQKFFLYALRRITPAGDPSLLPASLGLTYFESPAFASKMADFRRLLGSVLGRLGGSESGSKDTADYNKTQMDLFLAMSSWLDDKRLYSPYTQLFALTDVKSKYLIQRLFENDATPWLDFVNIEAIREDVEKICEDYLTAQQSNLQTYQHTNRSRSSASMSQSSCSSGLNRSPLSRLIDRLRRNNNATTTSEAVALPDLSAALTKLAPPIDEIVFLDAKRMTRMFNASLEALEKGTMKFGSIVSMLSGMDANFLELLKHLYYKFNNRLTVKIECEPGMLRSCRQPITVIVQVVESKVSQATESKLDENRRLLDAQIELLCKLPLDVSQAALSLFVLVDKLLELHAKSASDRVLTESGVQLFYHILNCLTKEMLDFAAAEELFAELINLLGERFIVENPGQAQRLLQLVIDSPRLGRYLVPLFRPSAQHLPSFVDVYKQLSHVAVQKVICAYLVHSMLCKFDLCKALNNANASALQLSDISVAAWNKIATTGLSYTFASSIEGSVFDVYLEHWIRCFACKFPLLLSRSLGQLLQASESQNASLKVWQKVLALWQIETFDAVEMIETPLNINPAMAQEILNILRTFFHQRKAASTDMTTFGLYARFAPYAQYLAKTYEFLLAKLIANVEPVNTSSFYDASQNQELLNSLWNLVASSFAPWIEPCYYAGKNWSAWTGKPLAITGHVLILLWHYYCDKLSAEQSGNGNVLSLYHLALLKLPWHELWPSMAMLQSAVRQMQSAPPSGDNCRQTALRTFVTDIFVRINWTAVYGFYSSKESPAVLADFLATVLEIGCRACVVRGHYTNCKVSFPQLLQQLAASFNWLLVPLDRLELIHAFLLANLPSSIIIADDSTPDEVQILRFLKCAFCFGKDFVSPGVDLMLPRSVLFVRLFANCLVQQSRSNDKQEVSAADERFANFLLCQLAELELIARACNEETAWSAAESLLRELLVFSHCCADEKFGEMLAKTLLGWFQKYKNAQLLLPFISATSQSAMSLKLSLTWIESAIENYFERESDVSWSSILGALRFSPQQLSRCREELKDGSALLTLVAVAMKTVSNAFSCSEETLLIREFLAVLSSAKQRTLPEAKLAASIRYCCVLLVRQATFGAKPESIAVLAKSFADTLDALTTDNSGLFGAIGLSRRITFPARFRLFCTLLSLFLTQQLVGDTAVRLSAENVCFNPKLAAVQNLKSQKIYAPFIATIDLALELFRFPGNAKCFLDLVALADCLAKALFSERFLICA